MVAFFHYRTMKFPDLLVYQVCLFSSHVMPVIQFQRRSIFLVHITKLICKFCIRHLNNQTDFFLGLNIVLSIISFWGERHKFGMDCSPDNIVHPAAQEVFHFGIVWEFLLTSYHATALANFPTSQSISLQPSFHPDRQCFLALNNI